MIDDFPVSETFNSFDYVPEELGWRLRDAPTSDTRSIEEISGGTVFQRGANLYRTGDSAYLGTVATRRGSVLEVGSQGTLLLNNVTTRARIDDPMAFDRQPRAVLTGDLTSLGDNETLPINRIISLAPRGELVYVRDDVPAGRQRYVKVLAPAPGEPVPQQLVTGWRLATSEELLVRGVAGWLTRNAAAIIERLKLEGFELEDGTVTTDGSEIVRAIAARLEIMPVVTYVLGEGR